MTSEVVGEGTYGCVLNPPLKCILDKNTKKLNYKDKVSKIMLNVYAKMEENEYKNINNIKGLNKYAITGPTCCKPLIDENFDNSVKNCKNKNIKLAFNNDKKMLSMLLLQNGGINIQDFIINVFPKQTLNEKKKFLTSLINLFDGLLFFQSNNIIHRDIKLLNIVYNVNNGKAKYIDFGLMTNSQKLRQNCKNNAENLGIDWSYYPPENSCTNQKDFDNKYNNKCLLIKKHFKTHDNFIDFVIKSFDLYSLSFALEDLAYYFTKSGINLNFTQEFIDLFSLFFYYDPKFRNININELKRDYIKLLKKYNYYLTTSTNPSPLVKKIVKKLENQEIKKADENECPPNKPYLNPKTNRCVKVLPKNKTSKKKCPPNKPYLNPKTNRCVKVLPKTKLLK
jgi:serine/threonine protein kinase